MSKKISQSKDYTIITFTDHVSAFNGLKRADIPNKGMLNNKISAYIFNYLNDKNINTQFIETVDEESQKVMNVHMIPLEIIIRNRAAGPWIESLGLSHGERLEKVIVEYRYKKDGLKDPLINSSHIHALNLCKKDELSIIYDMSILINNKLKQLFCEIDIDLVDLKLEFGINNLNEIVLADSITPDTMRLWDTKTSESLDKDVFRKDLGKLDQAYKKILSRLESVL